MREKRYSKDMKGTQGKEDYATLFTIEGKLII